MYATHEGLSKLYKVSCSELDYLVDQAKLFPAVIGSRLMGGGFGGCTINVVEEAGVENFIQQTILAYQQQFTIQSEAYIVATSDGTARVSV
jgi:galactokinase